MYSANIELLVMWLIAVNLIAEIETGRVGEYQIINRN